MSLFCLILHLFYDSIDVLLVLKLLEEQLLWSLIWSIWFDYNLQGQSSSGYRESCLKIITRLTLGSISQTEFYPADSLGICTRDFKTVLPPISTGLWPSSKCETPTGLEERVLHSTVRVNAIRWIIWDDPEMMHSSPEFYNCRWRLTQFNWLPVVIYEL